MCCCHKIFYLFSEIRPWKAVFYFSAGQCASHSAGETIEVLRRDTPDFIPPTLWPPDCGPDSQDLNPVDHKVWSVMEGQVYLTSIYDVNYLKQRLLDVWAE